MVQATKSFQVIELDDGSTRVISMDRRQMARWYGLDYLTGKAQLTSQGSYLATLSPDYYFAPTFRKKKQ